MSKKKTITFLIVLLSFLIRVYRLDIPHGWSFDEVYHALSAEAYALNDPAGYEWWHQGPKDLAYEWLHPPLGKLFMAASIKIFAKPYIPVSKEAPLDGATTFAWRFPGTVFAALTVWLLIIFGTKLFKNYWVGAVAGILYGLDGLSFVQSRTGMNDIYITFFVLLTFYFIHTFISSYPHKKWKNIYLIGVASGLAAATKWTGFYAVGIAFLVGVLFVLKKRDFKLFPWSIFSLIAVPIVIYFLSYGQWWLQGHTWKQFYELHQQIWWYQTGLKAHHDYESKALTWPFLIRPVWFYVSYEDKMINGVKTLYIGNIYTMGHPFIWWVGDVVVLVLIWQYALALLRKLKKSNQLIMQRVLFFRMNILDMGEHIIHNHNQVVAIGLLLLGYFGMFVPWVFSPRIMFMYHYLPAVPFLCLILAFELNTLKDVAKYSRYLVYGYLLLVVVGFIYFYPHWSDLPLSQKWVDHYYWLKTWK